MIRKRPILVTGAPRTGTTWVGKTISEHQRIVYIHEPFNSRHPNPHFNLQLKYMYTYAEGSDQKEDIVSAIKELLRTKQNDNKLCTTNDRMSFIQKLISFYNTNTYSRVLIKDPIAILSAGWLFDLFNFKVICLIRNPLGFVASIKKQGWETNFTNFNNQTELMQKWLTPYKDQVNYICKGKGDIIDNSIILWNILHFVIRDYQKKYPNWLFIKHEEIAKNPLVGFKSIFSYINEKITNQITNYIEDYTSSKNPVYAKDHNFQKRDAIGIIYSWEEVLTYSEIIRIKEGTKELASHFYKH